MSAWPEPARHNDEVRSVRFTAPSCCRRARPRSEPSNLPCLWCRRWQIPNSLLMATAGFVHSGCFAQPTFSNNPPSHLSTVVPISPPACAAEGNDGAAEGSESCFQADGSTRHRQLESDLRSSIKAIHSLGPGESCPTCTISSRLWGCSISVFSRVFRAKLPLFSGMATSKQGKSAHPIPRGCEQLIG